MKFQLLHRLFQKVLFFISAVIKICKIVSDVIFIVSTVSIVVIKTIKLILKRQDQKVIFKSIKNLQLIFLGSLWITRTIMQEYHQWYECQQIVSLRHFIIIVWNNKRTVSSKRLKLVIHCYFKYHWSFIYSLILWYSS